MMESNGVKTLSLFDLNTQKENMRFCAMDQTVLTEKNGKKRIIITGGVTTCLVVIIYHPQSTFTLFSHINSSVDILAEQTKFISIFDEKKIPLQELHVYLAGGIPSHFESNQAANMLKEFWTKKKPVKLNVDLLLSRDFIFIDKHDEFIKAIQESVAQQCLVENIAIEYYNGFFINVVNPSSGIIFHHKRLKKKNYPNNKNQYEKIEIILKSAIKEWIKTTCTLNEDYINNNELLMTCLISNLSNPQNISEKRIVISFHDPHKAVLHLVGFDSVSNELFISTDDCVELADSVVSNNNNQSTGNTVINPLNSPASLIVNIGSPTTASSNAHNALIEEIKQIDGFDPTLLEKYLNILKTRQYLKALRTACNSCKPIKADKAVFNLIRVLLKYKDEDKLDIKINEPNTVNKAAIHYAASLGNKEVYDLLVVNGADEGDAKNVLENILKTQKTTDSKLE